MQPCQVCHRTDGSSTSSQSILKCVECKIHVHKVCYYGFTFSPNIHKESAQTWMCDTCVSNSHHQRKLSHVQCAICGSANAMPLRKVAHLQRRVTRQSFTHNGSHWAHAICVALHPYWALNDVGTEVIFQRSRTDSTVEDYRSSTKKCEICGEQMLWGLKCMGHKCGKVAHPPCALIGWNAVDWEITDRLLKKSSNIRIFCKKACLGINLKRMKTIDNQSDKRQKHSKAGTDKSVRRARITMPKTNQSKKKKMETTGTDDEKDEDEDYNFVPPDANSDSSQDNYSEFESDESAFSDGEIVSDNDEESEIDANGDVLSSTVKNFTIIRPKAHLVDHNKQLNGFAPSYDDEPFHFILQRRLAFDDACCSLIDGVERVISTQNQELSTNLIEYASTPNNQHSEKIKTAVISLSSVISSNTDDLAQSIYAKFQSKALPVVFVSASHFHHTSYSKINNLLSSLSDRLMHTIEIDEEELNNLKNSKLPLERMKILAEIMRQNHVLTLSVFFCDFERIDCKTFDLIVSYLHEAFSDLLLIGILSKSSMEQLRSRIFNVTLQKLSLKGFCSKLGFIQGKEYIYELFKGDKFLQFNLSFGLKSTFEIIDNYLEESMSLESFIHGMRLALLNHFSSSPLSFLWRRDLFVSDRFLKDACASMTENDLKKSWKAIPSLKNLKPSKSSLFKIVTDLIHYRKNSKIMFDFISETIEHLFTVSLQRPSWAEICEFLSLSSQGESIRPTIISSIEKGIQRSQFALLIELVKKWIIYLKKLTIFNPNISKDDLFLQLKNLMELKDSDSIQEDDMQELKFSRTSSGPLTGKKRRAALISSKSSQSTPLVNIRNRCVSILKDLLQ